MRIKKVLVNGKKQKFKYKNNDTVIITLKRAIPQISVAMIYEEK